MQAVRPVHSIALGRPAQCYVAEGEVDGERGWKSQIRAKRLAFSPFCPTYYCYIAWLFAVYMYTCGRYKLNLWSSFDRTKPSAVAAADGGNVV